MQAILKNLLRLQSLQFGQRSSSGAESQMKLVRAQIPAGMLAHYDRFAARRKHAVAIVQNQVCTGCHMQVPVGQLAALMHRNQVEICGSCGRYLYLPQESASASNEPAFKSGVEDRDQAIEGAQ